MDDLNTLLVSVRERDGTPLLRPAIVRLSSRDGGQTLVESTRDASTAVFASIRAGDYQLQVEAPGYRTAVEQASIASVPGYTVYVFLDSESFAASSKVSAAATITTPALQKETNKAVKALKEKHFDEARRFLLSAEKMAPSDPNIQFLFGMLEYAQKNIAAARKRFETVLSLYPAHERTLLALGQIQLEAGEIKEARQTLEKALQSNTAHWQTHLLLALACAQLRDYQNALSHAARTAELNPGKKAFVGLLRGKIFARQGKLPEAREALESVVRDSPGDPAASEAKELLAKFNQPAAPAPDSLPVNLPTPPAPPVYERPWAPPDIDSEVPGVAPDVSCSGTQIAERTRDRMLQQLAHLERFGATEHIDHQEIDSAGFPGPTKSHNFMYLIFINWLKKDFYYLEESRDGGESLLSFPTSLATLGLVALGVNVFHPVFSSDFLFTCEGLADWRGRAAWQVRFEQRRDVPSRIRKWKTLQKSLSIPLKGRVWIAANTFDLLHIETDLREPVKDLELLREHLAIDYGTVKFQHGKTELWLPSYAEMFFQLRGKRYHHQHTLTDYVLFSVESNSTIATPPLPKDN